MAHISSLSLSLSLSLSPDGNRTYLLIFFISGRGTNYAKKTHSPIKNKRFDSESWNYDRPIDQPIDRRAHREFPLRIRYLPKQISEKYTFLYRFFFGLPWKCCLVFWWFLTRAPGCLGPAHTRWWWWCFHWKATVWGVCGGVVDGGFCRGK